LDIAQQMLKRWTTLWFEDIYGVFVNSFFMSIVLFITVIPIACNINVCNLCNISNIKNGQVDIECFKCESCSVCSIINIYLLLMKHTSFY
jgi:hypothetical protein